MRTIAINVALLAVGLAVIELLFGGWIGASRLNQLNLPRNVSRRVRVDNLYGAPGETVSYRRDAYGLRGPFSRVRDIAILTVGGSTTDERYIDEGKTWHDALARALAARGKPVAIANGGVDGHTTVGHIKSFELWYPGVPGLKPRFVLVYAGINDFFGSDGTKDDLMLLDPSLAEPLRRQVEDNSALFFLFRTLTGHLRATYAYGLANSRRVLFGTIPWVEHPLRNDHPRLWAAKVASFEERLRALAARIGAFGSRAIWVTQTMRYWKRAGTRVVGWDNPPRVFDFDANGVDWYRLMRLLNLATLRVCVETNGICVDLAEELELEDSDFYDWVHVNPTGTGKTGRYLAEKLARAL